MAISVLIATYNRAPLLRTCLAQLARQAFEQGDEAVVVDNGSTDDTSNVVSAAGAHFPAPLRYVLETTPGKSRALAAALSVSRGDLVALTDDDVIVNDDWIAMIRGVFREAHGDGDRVLPLGLVGGRVVPRWERPAPGWLRLRSPAGYGRLAAPLALLDYGPARAPLGARTALGANMAVTRRALDAAGGFPLDLGKLRGTLLSGEDHELCERVQAAGFGAVYEPRLVVAHYVPANRLRLSYHVRWFFWSGITNAALDRDYAAVRRAPGSGYWAARMSREAARAVGAAATGRAAAFAEAVTEVAFSFGYLACSRGWVHAGSQTDASRTGRAEAA